MLLRQEGNPPLHHQWEASSSSTFSEGLTDRRSTISEGFTDRRLRVIPCRGEKTHFSAVLKVHL